MLISRPSIPSGVLEISKNHFNLKFSNIKSNIQNALKPNQTRARFYLDQNLIETIDLQSPIQDDIQFSIDDCRLDILTENSGRINFSVLDGNHVGLGEPLYLNNKILNVWNVQERLSSSCSIIYSPDCIVIHA